MPWSRLRTNGSGESENPRRHSTIDPPSHEEQNGQHGCVDASHLSPENPEPIKAPSPLRNSFEPPAGEEITISTPRPQSPVLQDRPPKRHRFSMLQYRHKSDPQLSKTARDQAIIATPPMPVGKDQVR